MILVWDITNKCNLSCIHCYNSDYIEMKEKEEKFDTPYIVNQLKILGIKIVNILGGEPLLRSDIVEVVKCLSENNLQVFLTTNATLLNEQLSYDLINAGLNRISFSLESAYPVVYEKIRGENNYRRALKGIKTFVKVANDLQSTIIKGLAVTIFPLNIKEKEDVKKILDLAQDLNLERVGFNWIVPVNKGDSFRRKLTPEKKIDIAEWIAQLSLDYPDLEINLADKKIILDYVNTKYNANLVGEKLSCPAGSQLFYLNHKLQLHPCNMVNEDVMLEEGLKVLFHFTENEAHISNAANIKETNYFKRFLSYKYHYFKNALPICKNCEYYKMCVRICPLHFASRSLEENKELYIADCIEVRKRLKKEGKSICVMD
ncbi:hypothetical protein BBF96_10125 [Anoxybacter fermentans]|uniref:Radical SAM core domain-containing protein n=1 Tax=Anoxybacter fermentans TaxID=1323375 RepID=A0A3S9SZI1_9FIRM|nr:radical SAM protein [Anoxybacter fermentans]AZR73708.1 hypothetical protein BBF96_10125 [Anoxybacter fermentans]